MSDSNGLIYPNIDLFAYYLAEGLGQTDEEVEQNYQLFCHLFDNKKDNTKDNGKYLKTSQQIQQETSDYLELIDSKNPYQPLPDNLDGFYYPVKLGDSYALQINCSGDRPQPGQEFAPRDLQSLQASQQKILTHFDDQSSQNNAIGKTWFVWGQLASESQDPKAIAQQIYQQLRLFDPINWQKDLKTDLQLTDANLLDGHCFELWQLPSDRGIIQQNKHLLICLFPAYLSLDILTSTIPKLYPRLLRLFLFRNKIIWAYQQSRRYKVDLKNAAKAVQTIVQDLPDLIQASEVNLSQLQQKLAFTLNLMSGYAETLSYLEEQKNTIETNHRNYQRAIKRLEDPNQDITIPFLEQFTPIVTEKYLPQITSDLASLGSGFKLLENSVRTIEGIINIEQAKSDRALNETVYQTGLNQAKSDRALNETIFAASAGLATSQIVGSVLIASYPPPKDSNLAGYSVGIFSLSILFGLIITGVILIFMRSRQKKRSHV